VFGCVASSSIRLATTSESKMEMILEWFAVDMASSCNDASIFEDESKGGGRVEK